MKGKLRKLLSVVVATAMTLSCLSVPALAATGHSDGNHGAPAEGSTDATSGEWSEATCMTADGHTYEIYQIFKGTTSGTGSNAVFSSASLGENAEGYDSAKSTEEQLVNTESETYKKLISLSSSTNDTEILEVIKTYWDSNSTPYSTNHETELTKSGDMYYVNGIESGYYLIKDADSSQPNGYYTLYVTKVTDGNLGFKTKGTAADVEKTVTTARGTKNESASIGDVLTYKLNGTVSSSIEDYGTYYYVFTDTLSKGLSLVDSTNAAVTLPYSQKSTTTNKAITVKIKATSASEYQDVTDYFYINATAAADGSTKLVVGIQDLKQLGLLNRIGALDGSAEVLVEYKAMLNDNAVSGANGNDVVLTYSNDPNNSGTPNTETPGADPERPTPDPNQPTGESATETEDVYTMTLKLTKKDQNGTNSLDGAVFKLSSTSGINSSIVIQDKFYPEATAKTDAATDGIDQTTINNTVDAKEYWYLLTDQTYTKTAPTDTSTNYVKNSEDGYTKYLRFTSIKVKSNGVSGAEIEGRTNAQGVVEFTGLAEGDYTLEEVIAPAGYSKIKTTTFKIEFFETKAATASDTAIQNEFWIVDSNNSNLGKSGETHSTNGVMECTVLDDLGSGLPSTGGIGTTIFYVAGTILVLGAAVALITRRRMKNEVK